MIVCRIFIFCSLMHCHVSFLFSSSINIAAARALMSVEDLSAEEVARRAMNVASDMCVYTNKEFLTFSVEDVGPAKDDA
jgi:hypothetical protein